MGRRGEREKSDFGEGKDSPWLSGILQEKRGGKSYSSAFIPKKKPGRKRQSTTHKKREGGRENSSHLQEKVRAPLGEKNLPRGLSLPSKKDDQTLQQERKVRKRSRRCSKGDRRHRRIGAQAWLSFCLFYSYKTKR